MINEKALARAEELAKQCAARAYEEAHDALLEGLEVCESPIEQMMLVRLAGMTRVADGASVLPRGQVHQINIGYPAELFDDTRLVIHPQFKVGKYRLDFLLTIKDANNRMHGFVVECDGHDFHEKTKEQAARDKSRDRFFAGRSLSVFRFTGSEIYADAPDLLDDLLSAIISRLQEGR